MPAPLEPDLRALEQALGQLQPAPVNWPRDRLLFEAGQAALAGKLRRWRWLCGACAVLAVGLLAGWLTEHSQGPVVRHVYLPQPRPVAPPAELPELPREAPPPEPSPLTSAPTGVLMQHLLRTGDLPPALADEQPEAGPLARPVIPTARDWQSAAFVQSLND